MSRSDPVRPQWLLPTPTRVDEAPDGIRALLQHLMRGRDLDRSQAAQLLGAVLDHEATDAQVAGALVALGVKGETVDELAGMADAMRRRATPVRTRHARFIDTAGTGSSSAKTFNVSTAAAFVIAGAGLPVAKHGSKAATSRSGSADVLGALGVNVSAAHEVSEVALDELGLCFMFAPLYHAATARVAHVRRELGVHTTFNLLGPLTNPAKAPRQIIGVWHPTLTEPLARVLGRLGSERAWVVHGTDGLDEVTLSAPTQVSEWDGEAVRSFTLDPASDLGLPPRPLDALRGGDAEANARTIRAVLDGDAGAADARDLVLANAAAALTVGGEAETLGQAVQLARASIESGAAKAKLDGLVAITNG